VQQTEALMPPWHSVTPFPFFQRRERRKKSGAQRIEHSQDGQWPPSERRPDAQGMGAGAEAGRGRDATPAAGTDAVAAGGSMSWRPVTLAEFAERVYQAKGGLLADPEAMLVFPDYAARPDADLASPPEPPLAQLRRSRRQTRMPWERRSEESWYPPRNRRAPRLRRPPVQHQTQAGRRAGPRQRMPRPLQCQVVPTMFRRVVELT
jgi:hypothetical protein